MNGNKFNYYDITDGWRGYKSNLNATQCQTMCIQNSSCLFAIHFFRNQFIATDQSNTKNRKPLNNALNNTCVLRNEFKIEYGTQKDSSSNIYYLIGIFVFLITRFFILLDPPF